jgi:hypothetical protein
METLQERLDKMCWCCGDALFLSESTTITVPQADGTTKKYCSKECQSEDESPMPDSD